MPIKPENVKRYPPNWKALRAAALERAGNCCEKCGVPNHWWRNKETGIATAYEMTDRRIWTFIVLTIAHLEHDNLETQDIAQLRAWCQKCHLAYDHDHHQRNARETRRARKAAGDLFA